MTALRVAYAAGGDGEVSAWLVSWNSVMNIHVHRQGYHSMSV